MAKPRSRSVQDTPRKSSRRRTQATPQEPARVCLLLHTPAIDCRMSHNFCVEIINLDTPTAFAMLEKLGVLMQQDHPPEGQDVDLSLTPSISLYDERGRELIRATAIGAGNRKALVRTFQSVASLEDYMLFNERIEEIVDLDYPLGDILVPVRLLFSGAEIHPVELPDDDPDEENAKSFADFITRITSKEAQEQADGIEERTDHAILEAQEHATACAALTLSAAMRYGAQRGVTLMKLNHLLDGDSPVSFSLARRAKKLLSNADWWYGKLRTQIFDDFVRTHPSDLPVPPGLIAYFDRIESFGD